MSCCHLALGDAQRAVHNSMAHVDTSHIVTASRFEEDHDSDVDGLHARMEKHIQQLSCGVTGQRARMSSRTVTWKHSMSNGNHCYIQDNPVMQAPLCSPVAAVYPSVHAMIWQACACSFHWKKHQTKQDTGRLSRPNALNQSPNAMQKRCRRASSLVMSFVLSTRPCDSS